jgi:transcription elongation factor Elf1
MDEQSKKRAPRLVAVHVCEKCGDQGTPSQINKDVNVTGVVVCKVCAHTGPLLVRIVDQTSN